jgi:hypothetical protein
MVAHQTPGSAVYSGCAFGTLLCVFVKLLTLHALV